MIVMLVTSLIGRNEIPYHPFTQKIGPRQFHVSCLSRSPSYQQDTVAEALHRQVQHRDEE